MRTSRQEKPSDAAALDRLAAALADCGDADRLRAILAELLSGAELRGLARRWQLLELLRQGRTQREIAAALGLSLGTVSRGARALRRPGSAVQAILSAGSATTGESP